MNGAFARPATNWERMLAEGCRDIRDLQGFLRLSEDELVRLIAVQERYPLFANAYYLSLICTDDPDDPIRRMCVPDVEELDMAGFEDTSGEQVSTVLPGLQHKYAETALVLSTNQCALHCRHCFRRRFVGISDDEIAYDIHLVADYIATHPEITNVLVSGGDALMNSNANIRTLLEAFARIPHVRFIRLGTRMPVVLPQRIIGDTELVEMLATIGERKQLYVVTQFNHPTEITSESRGAVQALLRAGVPVYNQTVLLKGVNDTPALLARLMDGLVGIGVVPYYVFQCRPTIGVKNRFQVPLWESCQIVEQARRQLNGPAKSFRFIMSHDVGKIEILGLVSGDVVETGMPTDLRTILFKFHQSRDRRHLGDLFSVAVDVNACWLDERQWELATWL